MSEYPHLSNVRDGDRHNYSGIGSSNAYPHGYDTLNATRHSNDRQDYGYSRDWRNGPVADRGHGYDRSRAFRNDSYDDRAYRSGDYQHSGPHQEGYHFRNSQSNSYVPYERVGPDTSRHRNDRMDSSPPRGPHRYEQRKYDQSSRAGSRRWEPLREGRPLGQSSNDARHRPYRPSWAQDTYRDVEPRARHFSTARPYHDAPRFRQSADNGYASRLGRRPGSPVQTRVAQAPDQLWTRRESHSSQRTATLQESDPTAQPTIVPETASRNHQRPGQPLIGPLRSNLWHHSNAKGWHRPVDVVQNQDAVIADEKTRHTFQRIRESIFVPASLRHPFRLESPDKTWPLPSGRDMMQDFRQAHSVPLDSYIDQVLDGHPAAYSGQMSDPPAHTRKLVILDLNGTLLVRFKNDINERENARRREESRSRSPQQDLEQAPFPPASRKM